MSKTTGKKIIQTYSLLDIKRNNEKKPVWQLPLFPHSSAYC